MKTITSDSELIKHLDETTFTYKGSLHDLEAAIGCYMAGRHFGWKPLLLIHDRQTIKKYERILKLNFKEELPDVGPYAHKSNAWRAVEKIKSFWKAVKGEIPGIKSKEIN